MDPMLQGIEAMVPEEVGARAAHSLLEEISRGGVCDSTHQVCAWRCSTRDTACMLSGSCSRVRGSAYGVLSGRRCSTAQQISGRTVTVIQCVPDFCCHEPCF